jgi:glucose-6-phosphate 1-dehydrogenase
VLGASGDLAKKKTFPALWALYREGLIPEHVKIYGFARHKYTDEDFRKFLAQNIKTSDESGAQKLEGFKQLCHYYTAPSYSSIEAFKEFDSTVLRKGEGEDGGNRLFYLALPPNVFVDTCTAIKHGAVSSKGWNRVIVEKPFGHDLESATKLSKSLGALFHESQLYRIDHYLGKEMVQNLMVLRFANSFFEPIWNRQHISCVRIVFKEDFGTQGRGGYFDKFGIIRDVMQNHLMQILSLVAMEPPVSLGAEDVRDEKVKVLRSMPEIKPEHVVTGQYTKDKSRKK